MPPGVTGVCYVMRGKVVNRQVPIYMDLAGGCASLLGFGEPFVTGQGGLRARREEERRDRPRERLLSVDPLQTREGGSGRRPHRCKNVRRSMEMSSPSSCVSCWL